MKITDFELGFKIRRKEEDYRKRYGIKTSNRSNIKSRIEINCRGEFSPEFIEQVEKLILALGEFASDIGLLREAMYKKILFFDLPAWSSHPASRIKKPKSLPALIEVPDRFPETFFMVMGGKDPRHIQLINLCRLLFARLFGIRFFASLYKSYEKTNASESGQFETEEKAAVLRNFCIDDPDLKLTFRQIGMKMRINESNAEKFGAKHFFRVFVGKEPSNPELISVAENKFRETEDKLLNHEISLKEQIRVLFSLNRKLGVLNPSKSKIIDQAFEQANPAYFNVIAEQSYFLISLFEQIRPEVMDSMREETSASTAVSEEPGENVSGETPKPEAIFRSIASDLVKSGNAHEFLIPVIFLSDEEKRSAKIERGQWIIKQYAESGLSEKEANRYVPLWLENLESSAAQRIYNLCRIYSIYLQTNSKLALSEARKNYHWLDLRMGMLSDLRNLANFFSVLYSKSRLNKNLEQMKMILSDSGNGWSYFISNALIIEYFDFFTAYNEKSQFNCEKFEKAINDYLKKKSSEIPYLRYAKLFDAIYHKLEKSFSLTIACVKETPPSLQEIISSGILSRTNPSDEYYEKISDATRNWYLDRHEAEKLKQMEDRDMESRFERRPSMDYYNV